MVPSDPKVEEYVRTLEACQGLIGNWLAPRAKDGQCKRAPKETLAYLELGCEASLAAVDGYRLRRPELVWTRYLPGA